MISSPILDKTLSPMQRALALAERGLFSTDPNPRVGCVIINDGEIVGEGWHQAAGEPHAEIHALNQAGERARGATCYVTLEPCAHHGRTPPCADALIQAGVKKVIIAMQDPNSQVAGEGIAALQRAGIDVIFDSDAEKAAETLNVGFLHRMRTGKPWVRAKVGMSLDGRTAMASGESQWITGAAARQDVQHWRARSSAIMTGINTVLMDDPRLNIRHEELDSDLPVQAPWRIVVDSQLRTPTNATLFSINSPIVIATAKKVTSSPYANAQVLSLPGENGKVNLPALIDYLSAQAINEVLLEAGPVLIGAMLQAHLVNELLLYVAPSLLGNDARGLVALPGLEALDDRITLKFEDVAPIGDDLRICALVQ